MSIIICAQLPYQDEHGQKVSAKLQAKRMLEFIKNVVEASPEVEIFITYSANETQSALLRQRRQEARDRKEPSQNELALIQGSNQAEVCFEMAIEIGLRQNETLDSNPSQPEDNYIMNAIVGDRESSQSEGLIFGFGSDNLASENEAVQSSDYQYDQAFFSKPLPVEEKETFPSIHLLPFTTMRYLNHNIVPATFGALAADINYFQEVRSGPGHEKRIIILWGNQEDTIAIGGGVSAHYQSPIDQSSLRYFKSTLQQELNESNIFNLNNPKDVIRVTGFIRDTLSNPPSNTRYHF